MSNYSGPVPGSAVRGTASGVLFMGGFGTLWSYTGVMGLQGWGSPWLMIIALLVGVTLIAGGITLIRASRQLSDRGPVAGPMADKRMRLKFNLIFAAEGIAIAVTVAICNATKHPELIPLIAAAIVGLHFLPLAPLFKVNLYYYTGILLCILPLLTWLLVPEMLTLGENDINAYMTIVGLGSALILWGTGLSIWMLGRALLGRARHEQSKPNIHTISR
ncbi:DUF7010 family protein [Paenibacillus sp. GCM10023252]|uniref:DUF7010 family protein n=1 Tax=Paenibacillus sp. GCM10023252 TaxID=3252649 RepID=UPI003611F5D5